MPKTKELHFEDAIGHLGAAAETLNNALDAHGSLGLLRDSFKRLREAA